MQDYLVLVNQTHPVTEAYLSALVLEETADVEGERCLVEHRTLAAFTALQTALAQQGVEVGLDSAYRTVEKQQEILEEFLRLYGEDYTRETVAPPGTSEHHTGLALDVLPKINRQWVHGNDNLRQTETFSKIHRLMPEYGFILRYPEGKRQITGYQYEPWHLRYVGREAAEEISRRGLTLEEYLGQR